jgi:WD40 repeat protein
MITRLHCCVHVGHSGIVMGVSWCQPNGRDMFVSVSSDKSVLLWDTCLQSPVRCLSGHRDIVEGLLLTPSQHLFTYGRDHFFCIWDLNAIEKEVIRDQNLPIENMKVLSPLPLPISPSLLLIDLV